MRRLVAVRLVNWYHFTHETFRLRGSTLLLGDNGSGKSTVLDAVQLALVADQGQVRFNKAANEQSRRSLYGYVRHKIGSEDESKPGQVRFGRGSCTSYVILGFTDDDGEGFACGVVIDATESDSSVSRSFFVLPGLRVEDVPAIREGDIVRTEKDLRAAVRALGPRYHVFTDARSYREELRQRLGPLPESFHRLIVKGLDFKLIGRVEDFVHSYLLDENPVDTASLQTNLENYKRLEGKAKEAEERVAALDGICAQGEKIHTERRAADQHLFLSLHGEQDVMRDRVAKAAEEIASNRAEQAAIAAESAAIEPRITSAVRERDRLIGLLQHSAVFQQREALDADLRRATEDLTRSAEADAEARRILDAQAAVLDELSCEEARDLRARRSELFDGDEIVGRTDRPAIVERLRETLTKDGTLGGRDLNTWRVRLDKAKETLSLAKLRLKIQVDDLKIEGGRLEKERAELEKGRQTYDDGVQALLHLLRSKLRGKREPLPLCEVIDVRTERWRNAVEGLLNTRRFNILVAPEDFARALSLYERNKRGYSLPGRGEVSIHGVGLIDAEKVRASRPRRETRSLAEQIETDDELAREYVDSVLGDVICCDSEGELRQHRRSITDTVMVYQNHVASQTNPRVYQRQFIGQSARVRRLDQIDRRLAEIVDILGSLDRDMTWLDRAATTASRAVAQAARLPDLVETAAQLLYLRAQVERLERQLASLDTKEIDALNDERVRIDKVLTDLHDRRLDLSSRAGSVDTAYNHLLEEERLAQAALSEISDRVTTDLAHLVESDREVWMKRYELERSTRTALDVHAAFQRQFKIKVTVVADLARALVGLKSGYVEKYSFVTQDVTSEDFRDFANERDAWKESRLPEYKAQIARAKEEAIHQLAEDIVFRLRERLLEVQRHIRGLNDALKGIRFGADGYQFTVTPAESHRLFYELIQTAGSFEKVSLFGNVALRDTAAHDTLQGLFDRLVEGHARDVRVELEQLADYRRFFDYDIKMSHADGTHSFYNRVVGDKSGGETQTPFYIAIFASMYRLYRQLQPEGRPSCGILLLDESFSKMDGARIASTLEFARTLELQLVLATPKERSELVAPHVGTSLFIHKDPITGAPVVLDFTKELAEGDNVVDAAARDDSVASLGSA
jgi:uncharacterized protein YPO0396